MSSEDDFSLRLSTESDSENQTHDNQKKDDAKRTQESPQRQLPIEIFESEESEVIRFERSIKIISTVTNKDHLTDNVCKNISETSNADSGKSYQLNSSSTSSEELSDAITSDSSAEFLGFKNPVQSFTPNAADKKRQALQEITTTGSEKNLSTNLNCVPSNFESTESEEENLPLNYGTDSSIDFLGFQNNDSERNLKRKLGANNYVSSDFESVKRKNQNISKINNSARFNVTSCRITESGDITVTLRGTLSSSPEESSGSDQESSDSDQESLISSEEPSHSSIESVGLKKSVHIDKISHSKKNDAKNIPSSARSNSSSIEILELETTSSQRNLPTNQNNLSSDFESIRKRKKSIPLSSSSASSRKFSDFVKVTSSPKRSYKFSSSDESDDSSLNNRNRFRARSERNKKRRKIISTSSSSDSEDTVHIASHRSRIPWRSKNKLSSSDENASTSVNTATSIINDSISRNLIRTSSSSDSEDTVYALRNFLKSSSTLKRSSVNTSKSVIKVSRKRKEEKIKKLRTFFINANVNLRREKYFWRDCRSNVHEVMKWIANRKNINDLIRDPQELQREIEVHLEYLQLNTRCIISLSKRLTRSQTAAQRWQHFLKYGNSVKRWPF